jgi:electron transport complex protein RnfD
MFRSGVQPRSGDRGLSNYNKIACQITDIVVVSKTGYRSSQFHIPCEEGRLMSKFTEKIPPKLKVMPAPHLKNSMTVPKIMRQVLYAVLPICAFSVYLFGLSVLLLIATTVLTCVVTECLLNGKITASDWSAVVTGVLLALTLPPGLPLWMAVYGGVLAMFVKWAFGGLGNNIFNPALVGRIFIQGSYPIAITTWTPPFALHRFTELIPSTSTAPFTVPNPVADWITAVQADGFSGATPLTLFKFQHIASDPYAMAMGFISGSTGETCAILIILCGLWLCFKKIADWRIPLSVISGAALFGTIFWLLNSQTYPDPLFILTSGGLLFGAFFMATDPVGMPTTARGRIIFGLFIGFVVMIIRLFGSWPEGVMCAILLGNAVSPLINRITRTKPYGATARLRSPELWRGEGGAK